ncbi:MAG: ferrochelatase [Chloroflexi bacterium]|nr:ferrochelatase [Chloroflexota bacterium]
MTKPTGVLLMAYGGPNSLSDVEPYLLDVRGGRPTAPDLVEEVRQRYARIGGRSPLLELTRRQADALQEALGDEYRVYVGMRHWHPYIRETMAQIAADGIAQLIAIVMAPHYSKLSIGAYMRKLREARDALAPALRLCEVLSWKTHPLFLDALAAKTNAALQQFSRDERAEVEIIFSAHSLPERILQENDPYPQELQDTVAGVVQRVGAVRHQFAFQSAGSTREKWLGPDVGAVIDELVTHGKRHILVQPVGFVCDHVEILYDVDIVYKQQAERLGAHLERAESLNDSPQLIAALADIVMKHAQPDGHP